MGNSSQLVVGVAELVALAGLLPVDDLPVGGDLTIVVAVAAPDVLLAALERHHVVDLLDAHVDRVVVAVVAEEGRRRRQVRGHPAQGVQLRLRRQIKGQLYQEQKGPLVV